MKERKSIESVLAGCRKNDRSAQHSLYEMFASNMLGICRRYASSEEEAEDIMIEGFLKVFQKLDQYKGDDERSLFTWIKTIMVNQSIDHFRMYRKIYEHEVVTDTSVMTDYTEEIVTRLDADHIMQMMEEMPEKQRVIFNLKEVEGYGFDEVAEMLQESVNTVRVYFFRARKWLQKRIKEEEKRF